MGLRLFCFMQHKQLTEVWQRINAKQRPTKRDRFTELLSIAKAKAVENTHRPLSLVTRRSAKQHNQNRGNLLIKSWPKVKFNVPIECVFVSERYAHRLSQLPRIT